MNQQQPYPPPGQGGNARIMFLEDLFGQMYNNPRGYRQQQQVQPPQEGMSKAAEDAYIEYLAVLKQQEEERLLQMKNDTMGGALRCAQQDADRYMTGLQEIRASLSAYQIAEQQKALGEGTTLGPGFDEVSIERLRVRYFHLMDSYLENVMDAPFSPAAEAKAAKD